ncbi:S8 family peptidase [Pilimelia columellifera]|uniref:S8 family peptidase n=1 Tax=Pilimelia columellifera TaxID=706574 RepID=UPI0031D93110
MVVFKPGATNTVGAPALADKVASAAGGQVVDTYRQAFLGFQLKGTAGAADLAAKDRDVAYVSPVLRTQVPPRRRPLLTENSQVTNWGLDRIDQATLPLSGTPYRPVRTGTGVTVYIIDTGVRFTHDEFAGRAVAGTDVADDGEGPYPPSPGEDCNGHGTHVAGVAAGQTYGVAPAAKVVSVRTQRCDGRGDTAGLIKAFNWILANARGPSVVNLSVVSPRRNRALEDAARALVDEGITVVAAAGNGDRGPVDACELSPGAVDEVFTVSATSNDDNQHPQYNYGSCVDVYSPGLGIRSAVNDDDSASETWDGTSFSAPHVSGAVAQYLQDYPRAKPSEVVKAIQQRAVKDVLKMSLPGPNLLLQVDTAER